MEKQVKWFFAEGLESGEWQMWPLEAEDREADFQPGMFLSTKARERRSLKGEWIVRFVPDEEEQDLIRFLDAISTYTNGHVSEYGLEKIVQGAIEADRNRTTRRKKNHAA